MEIKKLPIGITDFEKMRTGGYVYVDKTEYVYKLVISGEYYFLSRPRRFGKTLLVDTLRRLFEGRKDLFEGLWIYDKWDWEKKYPVIRVDFSSGEVNNRETLEELIFSLLKEYGENFNVEVEGPSPGFAFRKLIMELSEKFDSRLVILVDEYDKPILDNIANESIAREIREVLADFYGVIKGLDEYLRFVFLTGVSKFSKVNLFSKLNNLNDITIDARYSAICGYKEEDLDIYFSEYLKDADRKKIRDWYNGYAWLGEKVYDPYDILLFIDKGLVFRNYWFETGTPTFLIELLKKKRYFVPSLETLEVTEEVLGSFDVDMIKVEALLWQTGYLTIKDYIDKGGLIYYKLGYPNFEVEVSLNRVIFSYFTEIGEDIKGRIEDRCYDAFVNGDVDGVISAFKELLASIPYTVFTKNEIDRYEGYYLSVLYSFLRGRGLKVRVEDITSHGRIDLSVIFLDKVYILELKMKGSDKDPLEQVKTKRYWEKYAGEGKEIYIVGVVIGKEERNVVEYRWKRVG